VLISCPECNTKVSDKAQACPHCGFRIDTLIKCPDCGQLVRPGTVACPGCGYPFAQGAPASLVINGLPDSASTPQPRKPVAPAEYNAGRLSVNNADYPKWRYRELGVTSSVLVSTNEIRRRIADGRMLRTVEVWTKGADKWRPASNYVALSAQSTSKVVSAEAAKSQLSPTNNVSRGTKHVWYYAIHEFVYGPASADDIYRKILDGQLPSYVSVWKQGSIDWAPATDYVFFSKEGPDVADVMALDSLPESDALPFQTNEQSGVPIASSSPSNVVRVAARDTSDAAVKGDQVLQDGSLSIFTLLWAFEVGGILACGNPGTLVNLLRAMPLRSWRGTLLRVGLWIAASLAGSVLTAH